MPDTRHCSAAGQLDNFARGSQENLFCRAICSGGRRDEIFSPLPRACGGCSAAVPKPPIVVPGFDDIAVMGEAVEQGRGHPRVPEHLGPFLEGEVGGDDQGRVLIKAGDEVEQERRGDE